MGWGQAFGLAWQQSLVPVKRAWSELWRGPWPGIVWTVMWLICGVQVAQGAVILAFGADTHRDVFLHQAGRFDYWWAIILNVFAHRALSFDHLVFNWAGTFLIGVPVARWAGNAQAAAIFLVGGMLGPILQVLVFGDPSFGASAGLTAWLAYGGVVWPSRAHPSMRFWPQAGPWTVGLVIVASAWGAMHQAGTNVGHLAHLVGLVVGIMWGLWVRLRRLSFG